MTLNILTPINQFNEGDDIWVFPDLQKSKALKKLDWYLNFQAYNSNFSNKNTTLIPSHKKLPTKAIVTIPFDGNLGHWCASINKTWQGLNHPTIRVFLPDNIKSTTDLALINSNKPLTLNVVLG